KCESALEKFQEAVDLNPKFSPAWYQQGLIHQNHSNYEEAEAVIDKALSHRSDWIDALIARGRVLWEQEKTDEFIRTVESVCELLPDDSMLLYECALRLEMDDPHKAAEFAERAYDTDESLVEALVCSLACSYEDGRYEDTIEYYERIEDRKDDLEYRQERIVDLYY
ncbi:tetratricopeptide repeat protein, partial [Halorubrum sp. ASP121]|uniref:tetratricopeptide repeat protein n=1 Tax=Halorubrum sp. ASP121 TaxID=1855858 RepID=UPI0010F5AAD0